MVDANIVSYSLFTKFWRTVNKDILNGIVLCLMGSENII